MIIKIIIYIFINLIVINSWIYISNKIFGSSITNISKTINIIGIGILSAGALFIINKYYQIIDINYINNDLNYTYIATLFAIPLIHFFINRVKIRYIYKVIINILIFLAIISFVNMTDMSDKILYYYIIVGFTEEFIKYNLANNSYLGYGKIDSDIILFGIISGLGFGLVENFIYGYNYINTTKLDNTGLFIVIRTIFGILIHVIFSGCLSFIIYNFYKNFKKTNQIIYIFYYILGISGIGFIHAIYNKYTINNISITIPIVIIIGYIMISYLFFVSDRRYNE